MTKPPKKPSKPVNAKPKPSATQRGGGNGAGDGGPKRAK